MVHCPNLHNKKQLFTVTACRSGHVNIVWGQKQGVCKPWFPNCGWRVPTKQRLKKIRNSQKTRQSTVQEINGVQSWISPPPLMAPWTHSIVKQAFWVPWSFLRGSLLNPINFLNVELWVFHCLPKRGLKEARKRFKWGSKKVKLRLKGGRGIRFPDKTRTTVWKPHH